MEDFFASRKNKFHDLADNLQKSYKRISLVRVVIFLIGVVALFYTIYLREALAAFIILALTFVAFGIIVNYHKKIKERCFFNEALSEINREEIKRLHLDIEQFDSGLEHLSEKHPYAYDLDIFGRYSMFQLINRSVTPVGKFQLANELKRHFGANEIKERQQAVKELSEKIDWRQNFQANGSGAKTIDPAAAHWISHWMKDPFIFFSNKTWKPFLFFLWLSIAITLVLMLTGQISFYWIFLFNVVNAFILVPKLKSIEKFSGNMGKTGVLLNAYSKMLLNIEESEFNNGHLSKLRQNLFSHKLNASLSIRKLNGIISYLDNRANLFYVILNSFFLLDIYLIYRAEAWKASNRDHVEDWFAVVAKFESLASLAAFSYINKYFCFPEISSEEHFISAKAAAHPLIKSEKRVDNDFKFSGRGAVALITGSNMAGKSTFLRTVGVNLVLAQIGAPVCASSFSFSLCNVFSSMRTKDNLEENVSTFYAELIRINQLIQRINEEKPLFYLLDEILKGTNSHDRHIGATALVKQLNRSNAFGFVSSHDIELTQLSEEVHNLENYSFHSEIREDDIQFDYKLHKGPCKSFNAVALMKKMGISIT